MIPVQRLRRLIDEPELLDLALLAARAIVPYGGWDAFCTENFTEFSRPSARYYMRLAQNRELIEKSKPDSLRQALALVAGEPDTRIDKEERRRANELRDAGKSVRTIARELNVGVGTVHDWLKGRKRRGETGGKSIYFTRDEATAVNDLVTAALADPDELTQAQIVIYENVAAKVRAIADTETV